MSSAVVDAENRSRSRAEINDRAPAQMVQCPSCLQAQKPRLICPDCTSPLAADLDSFAALGIPRKLQIDTAMLESAYHDLSRKLHPDRYASAAPKVRDASLRAMALVTRAYRTMRDP